MSDAKSEAGSNDVALVGMALRLPGASHPEAYWANLSAGVESVRTLTDAELLAAGVSADKLASANYVKAGVVLEDFDAFDPEFFGLSPKEAAIMDPQHRCFLECAWEALEDAGHLPESFPGAIGVFGGVGMGSYYAVNLLGNRDLVDTVGPFLLRHTGNDKDFLTTRVSYCLNLRGPSVNVQTACSTSLVAVHLACQSLLSGECDLALAGGVTIEIPHGHGYLYQAGEILSPDGHCRAFDHRAAGTIFGSGAGIVALRRLSDALADGDRIYAVIKGSAVNNDGSSKVSYLAPSVDGQAAAIVEALAVSGVSAESIGYVECHGTGTPMGDPIEISALSQAFRRSTARTEFCAIGSVKTNIGHLDTAAGVAGLIKAALSLAHRQIPPTLHFEAPNPHIDFAHSPFVVSQKLTAWPRGKSPRRAGVNSLGVGGTNAHVVLEEAPERKPLAPSCRPYHLLALSARSRAALDAQTARLAAHLSAHPEQDLADVAHTLATARRAFSHRRVLAVASPHDATALLLDGDPQRVFTHEASAASVAFMFPGGGAQYPGMAYGLYQAEPVFRAWMDKGLSIAERTLGAEFRSLLLVAPTSAQPNVGEMLERPSLQLPAIFIVEYALAQLWLSYGVTPSALIGHSMGENTAACLASVFSFEDALGLVMLRGALMDDMPEGGMLSVPLAASELAPLLDDELDLASVNAPALSVASGPRAKLAALEKTLAAREIECKWVRIHIAAHSRMLSPMLGRYEAYLRSIALHAPQIPVVSNFTGTWLTPVQATDPTYWVSHLRNTVRFADGVSTLLTEPSRVLLEVGPGKTLSSLARLHPQVKPGQAVLSTLRHQDEAIDDAAFFLTVFGRLWAAGVDVAPERGGGGEKRAKVALPSYAFQRQKYFIESRPGERAERAQLPALTKLKNLEDWFYRPAWRKVEPKNAAPHVPATWLIFLDDAGIGDRLRATLEQRGDTVVVVRPSDAYYQLSHTEYRLSPEHGRDGYDALVRDLWASGKVPSGIVHLWLFAAHEEFRRGSSFFHRNQERGFYSLLFLGQALADQSSFGPMHLTVVSSGMQQVASEGLPYPDQATVLGPCQVLPKEIADLTCASVDVEARAPASWFFERKLPDVARLASEVMNELAREPSNRVVALRAGQRYERTYEKLFSGPSRDAHPGGGDRPLRIRDGAAYLITGGLGGVGLSIARHLAETSQVKLVLLSRSPIIDRAHWGAWLASHGQNDAMSAKILGLEELERLNVEVMVFVGDVTDPERMRLCVAQAKERFGAIRGVFHAAGVVADGLVSTKSQAAIEGVFAPKVHGTQVLESALVGEPLDFLLLFSSTSTVTAPLGQIDYVAANAYLNAFAESRRHDDRYRTIAVNWGIWKDVGMATRLAEGARRDEDEPPGLPTAALPATHPLFATRMGQGETQLLVGTFGDRDPWILDEHRTRAGRAVVPGTAYLEMAQAALSERGESGPFEVHDLFFLAPLSVEDGRTKVVRAKLVANEQGYDFELQSREESASGRVGWELHAQAKLVLGTVAEAPSIDLGAIATRCADETKHKNDDAGIASGQERHLAFGPRWRVLTEMKMGDGEALGQLVLPEAYLGDLTHYALHPALLDIGTGFAMDLIPGYDGEALWVPISYKRVRVHAPLTARLASWVRRTNVAQVSGQTPAAGAATQNDASGFVSFDVVLADASGRVLVEVEELTLRRLETNAEFAARVVGAGVELERATSERERPLSAAEQALVRQRAQGIASHEGCRAVDLLLARTDEPVVIVSSLDLGELVEEAQRRVVLSSPSHGADKFARPALSTPHLLPRDDIERTLAGFWEELLGVERVGVEDNFFDLGGHSLIAVRLFAKIKKTYRVDYPISVLFEAPTIARCAEMLRARVQIVGPSSEAEALVHRTRLTHLVPMHPSRRSKEDRRAPFFLVAGMFGNVLNLRHLAHLIGRERRFYGLQARGLYGDHTPHETFEEMAADYITELRTVAPHGPYLLGGFSGGGITAFEIAKQLMQAGETVSLLVLLDTPLPISPELTARDRWMLHVDRIRQRGAAHLVDWMKAKYAWESRAKEQAGHERAKKPFDFHSEAIEEAFRRALSRYRLVRLPVEVSLFRPRLDEHAVLGRGRVVNRDRRFIYHDNGWAPYVSRVQVCEVPGDHDSMVLEPNVRVLAARLRACIDEAELHRPRRQEARDTRDVPGGERPRETTRVREEPRDAGSPAVSD